MTMKPLIIGFCAPSGTGKTTLLTSLLPCFVENRIRVGVIKHAHHNFDTDQPGKDSYELRKSGAEQMLVSSSKRWALITELSDEESEATLNELIAHLDNSSLDLILVEGFKREAFPKIELHRQKLGKPAIYPQDQNIIAFATDAAPPAGIRIPVLDLNSPKQICDFIIDAINGLRLN